MEDLSRDILGSGDSNEPARSIRHYPVTQSTCRGGVGRICPHVFAGHDGRYGDRTPTDVCETNKKNPQQ